MKPRLLDDDATTDTSAWVGIAFDNRTGHYWHAVPGQTLPACVHCWLWMTDWSLINDCYLRPASAPHGRTP